MSIHITVYDGMTPMLDQIALVSRDAALDCLTYAGIKLRTAAREALRSKRQPWVKYIGADGKIYLRREFGNKQELGVRLSHDTLSVKSPGSMANFISSYLDERNMLMVVGGRHKTAQQAEFRDGIRTGKMYKVKGIGSASHAILHMMNFGEQLPEWPQGILAADNRFGYRFMETGYNRARGEILGIMTNRYNKLITRHSEKGEVKTIKRVVA